MLTAFTAGKRHFTVEAPTLEAALRAAELAYPLLRVHLFNEKGAVREHVQIFLNSTDCRDLPSLNAPLSEGDEIIVLQAISGGLPKRVDSSLGDPVDQAGRQGDERRQQPQPPPRRAGRALDHLVPAESAKAIEGPGDAPAVVALMQLQAAVGAARLVVAVDHHHRRLIAARTEAGRNQRQRRQLHDFTSVAGTAGVPPAVTLSLSTANQASQGETNSVNPIHIGMGAAAREAPGDEGKPSGFYLISR
jgi:molybdopterin synthase sulfur carrier subunit